MRWVSKLFGRGIILCSTFLSGLGKTIQVISFFAQLKEKGNKGPHLVVVPCVIRCLHTFIRHPD